VEGFFVLAGKSFIIATMGRARRWVWWTVIGILLATLAGFGAWHVRLALPEQMRRIERALLDEAARYGIGVSWRNVHVQPLYLKIVFDDVALRDTIANLPLGTARRVDVSISPRLLLFGESPVSRIRVSNFTFRFGEADRTVLDRLRAAPSGGGPIPDILLFDGVASIGPFGKLEQFRTRIISASVKHVRFFGTRVTFSLDNAVAAVEYPLVGEGSWPFPAISGDLFVKDNEVNVRRFKAEGAAASLKASGRLDVFRGKNDLKLSGNVDLARWIARESPGARIAGRFVREGKCEFSASLKGTLADPAASAKVILRNGRFEGVDAAEFDLAVSVADRKVKVAGFKGTLWRGALSGNGEWDIAKKRGSGSLSLAKAALGSIPLRDRTGGWRPAGYGDVTVAGSGTVDELSGSVTIAIPDGLERAGSGGIPDRVRLPVALNIAGKARLQARQGEIQAARLLVGEHAATASGTIDWGSRNASISGTIVSHGGRAADLGLKETLAWRHASGDYSLDGDFDALAVNARLAVESLAYRSFPSVPASAKVEGNLADFIHFVADVPADLAKVTTTGTVTAPLSPNAFQVDASISAREIDFSGVSGWLSAASASFGGDAAAGTVGYLESLRGRGTADLEIAHSKSETTVSGVIRSDELSLREVKVRAVSVEGELRADGAGRRWKATGKGEIAGGTVGATGVGDGSTAGFAGSADGIDVARASSLIPGNRIKGLGGTASIRFSGKAGADGRIELPEVRVSVQDLSASGISWGNATGEAVVGPDKGTFRISSTSPALRLSGAFLRASGLPASFRLAGTALPTSLLVALGGGKPAATEGKWDVEADGQLQAAGLLDGSMPPAASVTALRFRLAGQDPSVSDVAFGSVVAEGRKDGDTLVGEVRSAAPDGKLSFTLGLRGGYPFHAEGPFSFGNRKAYGPDEAPNRFSMTGKVELAGSLEAIDKTAGSLQVDQFRYKDGGIDLVGKELSARLGSDGIRWNGGTIVASGNPITVSGRVSWKGELDARVEGKLPAAMIRLVKPVDEVFSRLDGTITMNLRVTGKADNPSIVGTGHLEGGVFSFKGYNQLFEDMKADAIISREKISFEHFDGRSGGGYLDGRGELPLAFDAGQRMFFSVDFLDMRYPYPDEFRPVIQGHAELFGPVENLMVTGDIEIQSARYTRTIRPQKLLLDFRKRLADVTARRQKDEFRVKLDVNVVSDGTIEIRNNLATAKAKGEFKVAGDTSRVVVLGAFDLLEGKIDFQGNVYDVKHLGIDFNDPRKNNPRIDGRAETKKNNYTVTVTVTGTLEKYEVDFVSDPPLGKNDIVSLLSLGVTSQSLAGQEGSVGASLGASIALGPYKGRVEEGIRSLVGLDKLAVEAAFSSVTKSFEPRFIVGKTFGDRLTVSVSTLVGATSDSSANAEFKLLENVFLQGSWQSATTQKTGDMGADIKFKYRYRTFKDFLGGRD
jgi:hypothetical protein